MNLNRRHISMSMVTMPENYECSNFDADCSNGLSICDTGSQIWSNATANTSHVIGTITDKVACLHGFVSGWKVWCNTDLSLCAKFTMSSVFPGVFADNESAVGICLANASDNVPNNLTSNILSPLSKHCDGWIDETTSPSWKAFEDMSTGWTINPPITYKQLHQQQEDINNTYMVLEGFVPINVMHPPVKTWNFVNYTPTGQISEKGTITIGAHPNFKEIADNGTVLFQGGYTPDPIIPGNSSLVHVLEISAMTGPFHPVLYKIAVLNPNHVKLTDGLILGDDERPVAMQNNTIDLTR